MSASTVRDAPASTHPADVAAKAGAVALAGCANAPIETARQVNASTYSNSRAIAGHPAAGRMRPRTGLSEMPDPQNVMVRSVLIDRRLKGCPSMLHASVAMGGPALMPDSNDAASIT
ncbi:hypothetical protein [Paraburkholderia sp. BL6669N2]|uniref:hypothetical protein n=1 Tax=Paraburkholderia sp. BL6669N2 TaxID=1938807 RepID=UPI0015F28B14|nr:hypothetical protein [Paraburkholderia sp. BL6669N2]